MKENQRTVRGHAKLPSRQGGRTIEQAQILNVLIVDFVYNVHMHILRASWMISYYMYLFIMYGLNVVTLVK